MGYIQQCRSVSIFAECILEFLACLFQTRCVKVVEHNYRPLLHELLGDSLTDAAGTAGYQGDFPESGFGFGIRCSFASSNGQYSILNASCRGSEVYSDMASAPFITWMALV